MVSPYEIAKQHGYSDEEINSYLGKKDQKYQQALDAGYSRNEIDAFLSKKKEPKESIGANVGRQIGRTGARTAETVLGAPRAFGEFLEGLVPEKALKKGASKIGLEKPVSAALEFQKKHAPYKLFPKSEDIRENVTKKLFGKTLEPKNKWESKADEFVSDFAALALPLPGSQLRLMKPALLAAGGNIASDIVGKMGGSKKEQTYAKLGTILAGSLINPGSARNLERQLYRSAEEARPMDANVNSQSLVKRSNHLEAELKKGDPKALSKRKSLDLISDIKSKVKNNTIDVVELEQFKRDINEARSGLYEEFKTDKVGRKTAKRNLDSVSRLVDDTLSEYGKTNPEWESFYRPANEVHGAIAQSRRARGVIERVAKKYGMHAILPALGLHHFGGAPAIGGAAATAGVGGAALLGGEIAVKFTKSPTLRKHYMNLINAALKDDAVVVHKNLEKLKKELEKD